MYTTYTGFVSRPEWRWVSWVSLMLIGIAFAPFLLVALGNRSQEEWRFMGALHQYHDVAAYLSRVQQGTQGNWLINLQYTPDHTAPAYQNALIQPVYVLLGQLSHLSQISALAVFHAMRLFAALWMYAALYQLGASIWTKVRTRRIFFLVSALGSGLGWIGALITNSANFPDLMYPGAYPFFSTLVSVHEPLTIGALAVLASMLISALRPGHQDSPTIQNGGGVVILMGVAIIFLGPQSLVPLSAALLVTILVILWQQRQYDLSLMRWFLWLVTPVLPITAYYWVILRSNVVVREWIQQSSQPVPDPLLLLIGLGLPLVIAVPGLIRAVRRFERDGDQFMLLWLLMMFMALYLPVGLGTNAIIGMMIPVAYFATRAVEDTWLPRIARRRRIWLYAAVLFLIVISNALVLLLPLTPILNNYMDESGMVLEPEYVAAFGWLRTNIHSGDVVLAAPDDVSAWVPYWTGGRTVYGHKDETYRAQERYQRVRSWYAAADPSDPLCESLLNNDDFLVSFVIYGPREAAFGPGACLENMRFAASYGSVTIYANPIMFRFTP